MNILEIFRIIVGSIFILFLSGYVLSYAFFLKKEVDVIERIALSFALSIAVVPLIVFYLSLLKVKINTINIILEVLAIVLLGSVIWYIRSRKANVAKE